MPSELKGSQGAVLVEYDDSARRSDTAVEMATKRTLISRSHTLILHGFLERKRYEIRDGKTVCHESDPPKLVMPHDVPLKSEELVTPAQRVAQAVHLAGVGHMVKGDAAHAAPAVVDLRIGQCGEEGHHPPAQVFADQTVVTVQIE